MSTVKMNLSDYLFMQFKTMTPTLEQVGAMYYPHLSKAKKIETVLFILQQRFFLFSKYNYLLDNKFNCKLKYLKFIDFIQQKIL